MLRQAFRMRLPVELGHATKLYRMTVVGNVLSDKFQVVRIPRGKYRHYYEQDKAKHEAPECDDGLASVGACASRGW